MSRFNYAVKTEMSPDYFTVMRVGTLKHVTEWADFLDAHPETIESRIVRESDGKIIREYKRR